MAKFCANCGKEVNEGQDICLGCGMALNKNIQNGNNASDPEKKATTGFTLGLISIIAWILPLVGYPVTICGIVFSSKGLKSTTNKTKAIVGLVLSIIFLIITLGNSIAGAIMSLS